MKTIIIIGVLTLVLLLNVTSANADAAPPAQPPGVNPEPGSEITQVRMVSETVILDILEEAPDESLGQARVSANFVMQNLGDTSEQMAVRFPIGASDGYSNLQQIHDLQVKVDGHLVETKLIEGEDPWGFLVSVPWVEFDVEFLPGIDVLLQVTYTLEASGELPFISFDYIFSTGAAWKDSIGSAALYVRFPYDVSDLNILPFDSGDKVSDHQLSAKELKWFFINLEPEASDNFKIVLVSPSIWKQVLHEREVVNKNPDDGEAWGRLAKLYKELTFSSRRRGFRYNDFSGDAGARSLFAMSVAAYDKTVERKWYDAEWHAGYADLLGYYAYHAKYEGIDTRVEAQKALQEIQLALKINPKSDKVREIADLLVFYLDGQISKAGYGYAFPGLTETPQFMTQTPVKPTDVNPTATRMPTIHPQITPTIPATQTPVTNPSISICGSWILAPFGLVLWIRAKWFKT